ncbi:MAG TPA: DUF3305 domain-containing protein [Burkholderiales bacterium]|jgi:hypothetical protein|nr:DUF3305 domain-containing protein [Burkholderiales bacterium]
MKKPKKTLAVIMQRRSSQNRWQSEFWEPWSVLVSEEPPGPARVLVAGADIAQWLHPGFELTLHRDEAEGYYMNVSSEAPKVFVLWRMLEDDEVKDEIKAVPVLVTASYDEAGRWMDGGHSVDNVAMPPEIFAWVGEYVEKNYKPEPKRRAKPRSFIHPKDRVDR